MSQVKVKIQKREYNGDFYAKYEILPLEKGYGNTIGTPVRRVLLSSIKGAALVKVKIKGIDHEFSTLKGMKEDILRFILNLSKVVFKMDSSDQEKITLKVHGKQKVTAEALKIPGNVEVVNPDTYICELTDDKAQLEVEAIVESGFGFAVVDNEIRNLEPGTIPLNKNFSPIDKVNVNIVSTRVGQNTDFEKVILEVWGNGGVVLDEALAMAVEKVLEQFNAINEVVRDIEVVSDKASKKDTEEENENV